LVKWDKGSKNLINLLNKFNKFISFYQHGYANKNQYLKALIEKRGYLLKSKKEKSRLLDEYCQTNDQNRNYVIRKIRSGVHLKSSFGKRKRKIIPKKKD